MFFYLNELDLKENNMCKYFLFFISFFSFGQTPFSEENPNTLALKACGYINLLDGGFGSIAGIEKGFLKNNSIGVKFIYNHFTPHRENNAMESIDYSDDKDVSLIAEYKYYFNFENFRANTGVSFYVSANYKTGKNTIDNDRDYEHDFYHREVKYNYFGPSIGAVIALTKSQKWTLDTQIGYLFGKKKNSTDYVMPFPYNSRESFKTNLLRFEIMLAYNIN